jgi:hypothetical protein
MVNFYEVLVGCFLVVLVFLTVVRDCFPSAPHCANIEFALHNKFALTFLPIVCQFIKIELILTC